MMIFFVVVFFFFFQLPTGRRRQSPQCFKKGNGGRKHPGQDTFLQRKKKKYSKKVQYDFNEANICGCLWVMVCDFRVFLVDTIVWWWDSTPQQPSRD